MYLLQQVKDTINQKLGLNLDNNEKILSKNQIIIQFGYNAINIDLLCNINNNIFALYYNQNNNLQSISQIEQFLNSVYIIENIIKKSIVKIWVSNIYPNKQSIIFGNKANIKWLCYLDNSILMTNILSFIIDNRILLENDGDTIML